MKGAGVSLDSPYITEVKKQKIPVTMSTAFFAKHAINQGVTVIGVTGTRGKSTVTHLLFEIVKNAYGYSRKILLGGNVKDISTLPFLNQIKHGDLAVLELDSWQLQSFGDEKISPQIAIFTNFFPDHLNYYQGDMEKYLADKAKIFLNQMANNYLIIGDQAAELIKDAYGSKINSLVVVANTNDVPKNWQLKLPGVHNRSNLALAVAASKILQLPLTIVRKTAENFTGVAGRLELIRKYRGVKIYNDTTATTPEATLANLKVLATKRNIILIMGGADKNLDFSFLVKELPRYCKEIILLPGTGTDKLKLKNKPKKNLCEAVTAAATAAATGDIILFSPAFASFGPPTGFQNEFDRGEQFNQLVKKL